MVTVVGIAADAKAVIWCGSGPPCEMTRQSGDGLFALTALPADEFVARLKAIAAPRRAEYLDHLDRRYGPRTRHRLRHHAPDPL